MCTRLPKKPAIPEKVLPKKSQKTIYGFLMTDVIPKVLRTWSKMKGQEKYFFDKPGMTRYYRYGIKIHEQKGDYIMVIVMATLALFQRRLKDEKSIELPVGGDEGVLESGGDDISEKDDRFMRNFDRPYSELP